MLGSLLLMYGSTLLGAFLPTVLLILCGKSWGQLPFFYLRVVNFLQSFFPIVYPRSKSFWPAVIDRDKEVRLKRDAEGSSASFNFLRHKNNMLEIGVDFTQNGLEAIIQRLLLSLELYQNPSQIAVFFQSISNRAHKTLDEISSAFAPAPSYDESLLRFAPLDHWDPVQKTIFYLTFVFRLLLLFPIRLALFISSFVFISLACVVSFCTNLTAHQKTWIAIVYCRLANAGLGAVVVYKDRENTPKKPGIAVSNHMTPNDIQIIFGGTQHGSEYGYVVTGQKHNGIIGIIEALVSRLCPSLWLERKCAKERSGFLSVVLKTAKQGGGPILLFPEGYCTNNTQVIQFRKAVFEEDLDIYPIAIRQYARYGDAFWIEDKFHHYLFRAMMSWAIVYEIKYLPKQRRFPFESNGQFASRVQGMIAEAAGIQQGRFDGGFWYKKADQQRVCEDQQRLVAACLSHDIPYLCRSLRSSDSEPSLSDENANNSDGSFCICELPKEEN